MSSEASKFDSEITVELGGKLADGKKIDELLLLMAAPGDTLVITARGEDEARAAQKLVSLIESGFGVEE